MNIDSWYFDALTTIMAHGSREVNKRTGIECAAIPGLTFRTDLEYDGFPLLTLRSIPVKNFIAEQCWFLSGSNDIRKLEPYTKIWNHFAEDNGTVTSGYGMRWRSWFENYVTNEPLDQLQTVIDTLKKDPTSRHGVVMMWDPSIDLVKKQKNVPCPYTFTLMIIGGRLHMHLTVRSNDMVLGFPTDAAGFAFLLMILAQELGVKPGVYTHSISNAHIYSNHYDAANTMTDRYFSGHIKVVDFCLPEDAYNRASKMDASFITECIERIKVSYAPLPPITGLVLSV